MYELAAELIIFVHFLFIVYVILGSLLCLLSFKLIVCHLLCVAWGVYIELSGKICPLTYLENWLLKRASLESYSDGFISKYIFKIVYPDGLTEQIVTFFSNSFNFSKYIFIFTRLFIKKELINRR